MNEKQVLELLEKLAAFLKRERMMGVTIEIEGVKLELHQPAKLAEQSRPELP